MRLRDLFPHPVHEREHFILRVVLLIILCLVLLLACSGCATKLPPVPAPVQSQCETMCYTPCVNEDGDTGVRWSADFSSPEAWDALGDEVVTSLSAKLRTCETHRKACEKCLQNLKDAGVIL